MKPPIVFVHGLWLHSNAWENWQKFFEERGYKTYAPGWPGESPTIEETRMSMKKLAGYGINEITEHYAKFIRTLPENPILIGHSFGGLIVQKLLGMNLGVAGVAIDPAQIKGVLAIPFSTLKVVSVGVSNPANWSRALGLSKKQFHYGFTNTLDTEEANRLYKMYSSPSPMKPLFQAAVANFVPNSAAAVDVHNINRGPLLLIAGGKDHTVPASTTYATKRLYRHSSATTELKEFEDRDHSLCFNSKWSEIAEYAYKWIDKEVV